MSSTKWLLKSMKVFRDGKEAVGGWGMEKDTEIQKKTERHWWWNLIGVNLLSGGKTSLLGKKGTVVTSRDEMEKRLAKGLRISNSCPHTLFLFRAFACWKRYQWPCGWTSASSLSRTTSSSYLNYYLPSWAFAASCRLKFSSMLAGRLQLLGN